MTGLSPGLNLVQLYTQTMSLRGERQLMASEGTCTKCNFELSEEQIRAGWSKNPNDYTTECPRCKSRFIAYFRLLEEDEEIAKLEFLSPFHVFDAMEKMWAQQPGQSKKLGEDFLLKKDPLIYWNLIRRFGNYKKGRAAFSKFLKTPATTRPPVTKQ